MTIRGGSQIPIGQPFAVYAGELAQSNSDNDSDLQSINVTAQKIGIAADGSIVAVGGQPGGAFGNPFSSSPGINYLNPGPADLILHDANNGWGSYVNSKMAPNPDGVMTLTIFVATTDAFGNLVETGTFDASTLKSFGITTVQGTVSLTEWLQKNGFD